MSHSASRRRSAVKFIDKVDIGLGSSVVVAFVAILLSSILFSMRENLALAVFLGHCVFLFITGTGLTDDINEKPGDYPEKKFESGYLIGAALSVILVALFEYSLGTYFQAQIAAQFGLR